MFRKIGIAIVALVAIVLLMGCKTVPQPKHEKGVSTLQQQSITPPKVSKDYSPPQTHTVDTIGKDQKPISSLSTGTVPATPTYSPPKTSEQSMPPNTVPSPVSQKQDTKYAPPPVISANIPPKVSPVLPVVPQPIVAVIPPTSGTGSAVTIDCTTVPSAASCVTIPKVTTPVVTAPVSTPAKVWPNQAVSELPNTGFNAWLVALLALGVIAAGVVCTQLGRLVRARRS